MSVEKFGRSLAALTLVGLLATGCTPDPAPTPTPAPTPSVSQTPTESPQEMQQRLDYEAAEKSYRTFRAEYRKVLRAGGAKQATPVMKATAGGEYLKEVEDVVQAYQEFHYHQEGRETIVYVRRAGHASDSVLLSVCEDDRAVKALDRRGKSIGPGEFRAIDIDVRKANGAWKLWSGSGEKVESCD